MLKYFVYKNTYFIIGCLLLILVMALLSNYKTNIEGFTYNIEKKDYNLMLSCGPTWKSVITTSGFKFNNNDNENNIFYNTIYMLSTSLDDITQLFNNYTNTKFNIDCSNILYTTTDTKTFSKYTYNNNDITFFPNLMKENSYIEDFYPCFKKLVSKTNPVIYFDYDSKNTNNELYITMINNNNPNNKYRFKINLSPSGKTYMDDKLKNFLQTGYIAYSTSEPVSGFKLKLQKDLTKSDITVYKTQGKNDDILRDKNTPIITTLIDDLGNNNNILAFYNVSDNSGVSKYNLFSKSAKTKYMVGTINYAGNQEDVIVQIPNYTV
jgi:hypothetical protein